MVSRAFLTFGYEVTAPGHRGQVSRVRAPTAGYRLEQQKAELVGVKGSFLPSQKYQNGP